MISDTTKVIFCLSDVGSATSRIQAFAACYCVNVLPLEEISLMPSLFTHTTRNKCAVKMRGAGECELQKREISSSSNYDTCFL